MKVLFVPGMKLVRHWPFKQKFFLVGMAFLLPALYMLALLLMQSWQAIQVSQAESEGVEVIIAVQKVLDGVQRHRGLSTQVLSGKAVAEPDRALAEQDIKAALDQVASAFLQAPHNKSSAVLWPKIATQIKRSQDTWRNLAASDNFQLHTQVIGEILSFTKEIALSSGLELDPEAYTYTIQDALLSQMLPLSESLGQVRGFGSSLAGKADLSNAERIKMGTFSAQLMQLSNAMQVDLARNSRNEPRLSDDVVAFNQIVKRIDGHIQFVKAHFLEGKPSDADPKVWFSEVSKTIKQNNAYALQAEGELHQALKQRIDKEYQFLLVSVGGALLTLIVGIWIFVSVYLTLQETIQVLLGKAKRLSEGNLQAQAFVWPKDEVGKVGVAVEAVREELIHIVQQLQSNVATLLQSSDTLNAQAKASEASADDQFNRATSMAAALEQLAVNVENVSDLVGESDRRVQQVHTQTVAGEDLMLQINQGITHLVESVSSVGAVIDDMGEESAHIGAMVRVISEVANQTNLLALNASIEAARAGEQGRGFAVVADEVRKLAERTRQATQDISQVIDKINANSERANGEMEAARERASAGLNLVAGGVAALTAITAETVEVSHATAEISNAMVEQKQASHDVARGVEAIARLTEESSVMSHSTAVLADGLQSLATELASISKQFKV